MLSYGPVRAGIRGCPITASAAPVRKAAATGTATRTARGSEHRERITSARVMSQVMSRLAKSCDEWPGGATRVCAMCAKGTLRFAELVKSSQVKSSVTLRRPASSSSVEALMSLPLSLPQSPILCLTPRSISSRTPEHFLFGVRVALIGSRSARYFSPTCSPRARMSAFMTCHLIMDPPPPSPSTPVLHCWLPEHIR